jgi:hypothetical protein
MTEKFDVESPTTRMCLRKCDGFSDYWTIERAEHSGELRIDRMTDVYGPYNAVWTAARLGSGYTDIEGTAHEMREIAEAIQARGMASFKRCAVECLPNGVALWSPRNSLHAVLVTHAQADALARAIEQALAAEHKQDRYAADDA